MKERGWRGSFLVPVLVLAAVLVLGACGDDDSGGGEDGNPDASAQARENLEALSGQLLSTGPHGEKPAPASEITLTPEELDEIRAQNATAAIVMHTGGEDWSKAQIAGIEQQFGEMGVEVIATTDANFEPGKQVSDIETVLAQNPSIILSIPTDPTATANAYQQAAKQGVKLVFMDNAPEGMEAGRDYTSVVSADNFGNGVASAHLMAEALGGSGTLGVIYHEADFHVTRQRYEAFKQTITEDYPDIEIVEETGIAGPDFAGDAQEAAAAMLTKNPDLDGIWGVWDVPTEGILAGARDAGRDDLVITTIDLGENVGIDIASDGMVYGLGAQRPFDQGVTEAKLAGYALLGKEAPPYVALPALPVDADNVLEAWEEIYHQPPPEDLANAG